MRCDIPQVGLISQNQISSHYCADTPGSSEFGWLQGNTVTRCACAWGYGRCIHKILHLSWLKAAHSLMGKMESDKHRDTGRCAFMAAQRRWYCISGYIHCFGICAIRPATEQKHGQSKAPDTKIPGTLLVLPVKFLGFENCPRSA